MARLTDYEAALRHRYRVEPGGEYVPGVTTVLGIIDKPGLKWGASRIAAEFTLANAGRVRSIAKKHRATLSNARGAGESVRTKHDLAANGSDADVFLHYARGEFDRQWRARADLGTRIHAHAERRARGESAPQQADEEPYLDALDQFYDAYAPAFSMIECLVLNEQHRYGGRFDAIMTINARPYDGSDRITVLGDWKTGSPRPVDVALQTVAYMHARPGRYDSTGALTGFMDLPPLDGCRAIYLQPSGVAGVIDPLALVSEDEAWETFIAARRLYEAHRQIAERIEETEGDGHE